ncbi:hypothetical protein [Salinisphaera sp. T31B1]
MGSKQKSQQKLPRQTLKAIKYTAYGKARPNRGDKGPFKGHR